MRRLKCPYHAWIRDPERNQWSEHALRTAHRESRVRLP